MDIGGGMIIVLLSPSTLLAQLNAPSNEKCTEAAAQRMIAAGEGALKPFMHRWQNRLLLIITWWVNLQE